ncbi:MAG TPA: class I SAM-dependent methyltransferase [Polyangiaceae bacterium]
MTQIENISDTARWVAVYRAMESARPDKIFNDPFAERLAGKKGVAIVDTMKSGRQMAWAMIVRTAIFDEIILDQVRNKGVDQVVNLAAGLDARAWRMSLPPTLKWVDVDLPGILDYKTEMLQNEKPVCEYEAVRLDLREEAKRQALFSQLAARSKRTLVVTEGLIIYLNDEQVASLARDLHAQPSFESWLIDLAHPQLLIMMKKMWGKNLNAGNAPFQFAPEAGTKFFAPYGWREKEFRSSMDEARRLKREFRMMWLWRILGSMRSKAKREVFRRFSGFVLLERT